MTDRIYATYTPTTAPGTFHTAIHFERANPAGTIDHYVIEAKPENDKLSAAEKALGAIEQFGRDEGPSRFGKIAARVKQLKPGQWDPDEPFENIIEGPDLSEQFARMHLFALGVNDANLPYRGDHQNSNTFASGALKAADLPAPTGIAHDPKGPGGELLEFFPPGLNEPLSPWKNLGSSSAGFEKPLPPSSRSLAPVQQADRPELRIPPPIFFPPY
jgi:hypothetical protein